MPPFLRTRTWFVEPRGLARLWQIGKEKLRLWPFPH